MRYVFYLIIMTFVLVIQSSISPYIKIGGVNPDFFLIMLLSYSIIKGPERGSFYGLSGGLIEDLMFGRFIGLNSLTKFLTCYITGWGTKNLFKGPAVFTILFVFIGSLIYNLLFLLANYIFIPSFQRGNIFTFFIYTAIVNAIFAPIVYNFVYKIEHFFDYYFNIKY
ncbi:rod shape-determining protein MreD [Thermovenabulum gondwanense]|uniref:Uncharacterized protein n=1 Tax=Thermovenabulum gondwanense TaxID=520767 RepID=A0A162MA82_9FIRM|nr:rod shape-determining protein MreD [Thermovenabulum gondwanense]KYO64775.1 hypothetical protein ATZ99_18330 [Thermovenabulum gondwanense]